MTAPEIPDYSGYDTTSAAPVDLVKVQQQAAQLLDAAEEVARCEMNLTEAQGRVKRLAEEVIPELFERAGLEEIKIAGGITVALKQIVAGSIPKGQEETAFDWMESNGFGALVKRIFTIKFGRADEKWADKFQRDCAQRKKPLNLARVKKVEPATLQKFIRDQHAEGRELPEGAFSVFEKTVATLKIPKP